jgi:hypothetical protein
MSIRRAIISPLVTLGISGAVLAGVSVPLVTIATSTTPAVTATGATANYLYRS